MCFIRESQTKEWTSNMTSSCLVPVHAPTCYVKIWTMVELEQRKQISLIRSGNSPWQPHCCIMDPKTNKYVLEARSWQAVYVCGCDAEVGHLKYQIAITFCVVQEGICYLPGACRSPVYNKKKHPVRFDKHGLQPVSGMRTAASRRSPSPQDVKVEEVESGLYSKIMRCVLLF